MYKKKLMQKEYLLYTIIRFLIIFIFLNILNLLEFEEYFFGVFLILIGLVRIVRLYKENLLISPIILSEMLLLSFGLYELHLVTTFDLMDIITKNVIILSIMIWELICGFNSIMFTRKNVIGEIEWKKGNTTLGTFISISFVCCALINILEWIYAGGIPIFRPDMETFRFKVVFNSTLHVIAMCMKFIPALIIVYCKFDLKFLLKKHKLIFICLPGSVIFLICTAFRGELMVSLVFIALLFYIYKRPKLKMIVSIGIIFACIMAIYPVLRSYVLYGQTYINDMMSISKYPEVWFLTPLYQTFANAFHILNKDILIFPDIIAYGLGKYSFLSNVPFLHIETLAEVQNRVWNNGFYAELTATVFGNFYADFGYIGCVIGLALIAILCNYLYNLFLKKKKIKYLMLYLFVFYKGFQMLYDNTFDFIAILYFLYLWMIFTFKLKGTYKYEVSRI